jgi:hypothetical protein
MKIIQSGKGKREDRKTRTTCMACFCVFEFSYKEGKSISDPRDGDAVIIGCPECGLDCWVASKFFDK